MAEDPDPLDYRPHTNNAAVMDEPFFCEECQKMVDEASRRLQEGLPEPWI
jgi:hypothetical protein